MKRRFLLLLILLALVASGWTLESDLCLRRRGGLLRRRVCRPVCYQRYIPCQYAPVTYGTSQQDEVPPSPNVRQQQALQPQAEQSPVQPAAAASSVEPAPSPNAPASNLLGTWKNGDRFLTISRSRPFVVLGRAGDMAALKFDEWQPMDTGMFSASGTWGEHQGKCLMMGQLQAGSLSVTVSYRNAAEPRKEQGREQLTFTRQ